MNNQKELIERVAESELVIEQLEVILECAKDEKVMDIVVETILRLQICLTEWHKELHEEQALNQFN